ncbi:MAG: YsnF/AvaK domain-containing protein [Bryobacteraceae bacterium]
MSELRRFRVTTDDGFRATLFATARFLDDSEYKLLRLKDGGEYMVPSGSLEPRSDGSYRLNLTVSELERYASPSREVHSLDADAVPAPTPVETASNRRLEDETVIPAVAEELEVGTRTVETGNVKVHKRVHQSETLVDEPVVWEGFDVKRVPVNRIVDGPLETRHEGDTIILPVLEEVVVVEKRLVLREELHITRVREEERDRQTVTLRREEVDVERS